VGLERRDEALEGFDLLEVDLPAEVEVRAVDEDRIGHHTALMR
jgi:hypothetical protein